MNDHIHELLEGRMDRCEVRINRHSDRLDDIDNRLVRSETIVDKLCKEISDLVSMLKWILTFSIVTLVGFFMWYIQNIGRG